ncbi:MAG: signal recognition particle protein Srp54 [Candidatus Bathyarchaeia archaeon]
MSALEKLGSSLAEALRKIVRAPIVDEAAVKELVRDVQRALLQADVNVKLVFDLSKRIEQRTLSEKPPPGVSRKEQVVKVIYEELTRFIGTAPQRPEIQLGKTNVFMLVGIPGSGKTTSSAKLARYFQKRGFKVGLVCADTFRLGAYDQLRQLAEKIKVPFYGRPGEQDPVKLSLEGVEYFRKEKFDVVLLDTAGRHKDEKNLIEEMKAISKALCPDEIILVVDATIGQQAAVQAQAFHEATNLGSILLTKLDGSARGGGALSAVAATGVPIRFIGTGEDVEDLEIFVPAQFVGRLLGMGDIQGLLQKYQEAEISLSEQKQRDFLKGRFTLEDMLSQMESMQKMGPLKQIINMIPGMSYRIPEGALDQAEQKIKRWRYILQSMTKDEKENPKILNASRIKRIARGSGTSEKEVRELIHQYDAMRKLMKTMGGGRRIPLGLRRLLDSRGMGR